MIYHDKPIAKKRIKARRDAKGRLWCLGKHNGRCKGAFGQRKI